MKLRSKHGHAHVGSEGDVRAVRTTGLASGGQAGMQQPGTRPVKRVPYDICEGSEAWDLHILLAKTKAHAAVSLIRTRDSVHSSLFK